MVLNGVIHTHRCTEDTSRVFPGLTDDSFFNLPLGASLSLFKLHLVVKLVHGSLDVRNDEEIRQNAGTTADSETDSTGLPNRRVVELEATGSFVHDEEDVTMHSVQTEQDWESDGGAMVRVLERMTNVRKATKKQKAKPPEIIGERSQEMMTATTPLTYGKSSDFFVQITFRPTGNHSHTDHTTHARVRGGDGHFQSGGDHKPDGDSEDDAKANPYIKRPGSPIVDWAGFAGSVEKLPSKHFWLAMPLRIVFTTWPPMNMAPVNSKTCRER